MLSEQQLQPEQIEEEESFYRDIEELQNHGINVADIKKLKSAGICTVKGIQMVTKKKLCNIKGTIIIFKNTFLGCRHFQLKTCCEKNKSIITHEIGKPKVR